MEQGSVLPPVLFVIVMNPLLKLVSIYVGFPVNKFYAGARGHLDIWALATLDHLSLLRE